MFSRVRRYATGLSLSSAYIGVCLLLALGGPLPQPELSANRGNANQQTYAQNDNNKFRSGEVGEHEVHTPTLQTADTPEKAAARYTYWLTLLTFVVAICNVALWFTTREATIAARRSADAAVEANKLNKRAQITGQRAWVNIENVELIPPTRFDGDRSVLRVAVTTKNLGQTPALSVEISVDSFVSATEPFRAAESKFLSSLRRQPAQLGTSLFPQDILVQRVLWTDDLSERNLAKSKVNLIIFVGVCYRVTGDETVHVTYQPYSMLNIQHGMSVADGQRVAIPRMAFLAGIAD